MSKLTQKKCVPCEGNVPAMQDEEIDSMMQEVPEWSLIKKDGIPHLKRKFSFDNFKEALAFTNIVGELAEEEGHHPLIVLEWGKVTVEWWTHAVEGLHQNDFIMAAKCSKAYNS